MSKGVDPFDGAGTMFDESLAPESRSSLPLVGFSLFGLCLGASCGFLDGTWQMSQEAYEARQRASTTIHRLDELSGRGAGGGSRGIDLLACGSGSISYSGYPSLEAPRPSRPPPSGSWYRKYCRGSDAPMCRRYRRRLRPGSGWLVAYLSREENDEEGDDEKSEESDPRPRHAGR